ncbi:b-cell lymphoma 3-encoded protein [Stemphylium lycopersici]|uniref:B-cell lymphoma 3-encoded protein n=1 Tax=Stemphylium lycopersici TaxID=183478 RepID=A0A364N004_STELY|nr:b-cell lymphoma 3-encoded protein [Stemphylium lycopersici]
MDPLSIASGILAVLTASGHTLQGLNQVWDLRHRSQEYAGLWNQTNGLRALLWGTEIALRHIKDDEQYTPRIQDCLSNINELVSQAIALFALLDKKIQNVHMHPGSRDTKKPSKRSWLRRKSKIVQLTSETSSLIVSLNAALSILQGAQTSAHASQTAQKIDLVLSRVEALTAQPPKPSSNVSVQLQNLNDVANNDAQERNGSPSETQLSRGRLSRRSSQTSFYSALSNSSDSSGTLVSFDGSLSADAECESFCPCQCHVSTESRMPWWITQVLGRMTIHGNGSMLLNRQPCNKKHCRKTGSARLQISYVAPAWTLLRAFNIYVRAETIGGLVPSINMFMPRVISNEALVWSVIELGKIAELKSMLAKRETSPYDISARGISVLKYAAIKGQTKVYDCLLSEKADPYFRDQTGMMAMQPHIDRVLSGSDLDRNASGAGQASSEILLSSESLEQQCFTQLHLIVLELQFLDLVQVLKTYANDIDAPDVNGRTALFWAAWRGDCMSVSILLKYGADVNKTDNQAWTPLAKACRAGHLGVVQCLLDAKASLTMATSQGFQPIHLATDNKLDGESIVKELLRRGADPNARSSSHCTPLHNAANRGSVETIQCLLANGSDINALDSDGDTPIMTSLLCWNEATFKHLATSGARLDVARRNGHTAVHIATWGASTEIWELLTSYAEVGKLRAVDLSVQHAGHDIEACFGKCRSRWYPGTRNVSRENLIFQRMIAAFRGHSNSSDL